MDKIIRGYWDCDSCGTSGIDGLVDRCPVCGIGKPHGIKYYMKSSSDIVSKDELSKAGISVEECDGKHEEWVCSYCSSLNNWADDKCAVCGASRVESSGKYSDTLLKSGVDGTNFSNHLMGDGESNRRNYGSVGTSTYSVKDEQENCKSSVNYDNYHSSRSSEPEATPDLGYFRKLVGVARIYKYRILAVLLALVSLSVIFFPFKRVEEVTGFSWDRFVTVEEERTVTESDWDIPNGGRLLYSKTEIRSYVSVIGHYETVTETKTREVLDHYDTSSSYIDNGNGTFSEITNSVPVYRTETYYETHKEPVYRQDPVYDTKYYYEIERWFPIEEYETSGNDKKPYWSSDYTLKGNERDTNRSESYYVLFDSNRVQKLSYGDWLKCDIGDTYTIVKSLLGITYKVEKVN